MNRHQRRAKKKNDSGNIQPGMVMERADTGTALAPGDVLDLEKLGKEMGGTPAFNMRKADPMHAFRGPIDTRIPSMPPDDPHVRHMPDNLAQLAGQKALADWLSGQPLDVRRKVLEDELDSLFEKTRDGAGDWAARLGGLTAMIERMLPTGEGRHMMALVKERAKATTPPSDDWPLRNRDILAEMAKLASDGHGNRYDEARKLQASVEIQAIAHAPVLQKLGETAYHKVIAAYKDRSMIVPEAHFTKSAADQLAEIWEHSPETPQIFVVQHDWAAAFEKATDFQGGEVRFPYSVAIFEFRISGHRVCCATMSDGGTLTGVVLNIETSVGWALGAAYQIHGSTWTAINDRKDLCGPITNLCRTQIRAMMIALEAEVAVTELVRAPHRLNRKRERAGKLPIFDHHVVSLANRKRYAPRALEPGDIEEEKHHRRLHFVRGHWRHYTNSKTWIKWHLRGDPDLGFVDKEYRL